MEFRCKLGSIFDNDWRLVPNPNDKEDCTLVECQGAKPLSSVDLTEGATASFLTVGSTAECWFRLNYPTPCIGLFDQGQIMIFARAI
jgi:hypothetical protein